jgi:hypothetical protein
MSTYNYIDNYLVGVDNMLCSDYCPCYLYNKTEFISDTEVYPTYATWNITTDSNGPVKYQNCSKKVHELLYKKYTEFQNNTLNEPVFWNYYNYIENTFNCVGFCRTKYFNDMENANVTMYKYMFTDVNRGIPKSIGCMNNLLQSLRLNLKWIGVVVLVVTIILLLVFILAIALCYVRKDEKDSNKKYN